MDFDEVNDPRVGNLAIRLFNWRPPPRHFSAFQKWSEDRRKEEEHIRALGPSSVAIIPEGFDLTITPPLPSREGR